MNEPVESYADRHHHDVADPHVRSRALTNVVLGGQDGLVNVLGIVLGISAATSSARLVLVAGLAAAIAESVSMAAVAFTSTSAGADLYRAERAREYRHIQAVPEIERAEIRAMYARKGFEGELLDRVVETITRSKDVWVAEMMNDEHRLADTDRSTSAQAAVVVGIAALIGSVIPLLPFLVLSVMPATWASLAISAATLFGFGVYKARATIGRPGRSGLELLVIGMVTALAGYAVGALLKVPVALP